MIRHSDEEITAPKTPDTVHESHVMIADEHPVLSLISFLNHRQMPFVKVRYNAILQIVSCTDYHTLNICD